MYLIFTNFLGKLFFLIFPFYKFTNFEKKVSNRICKNEKFWKKITRKFVNFSKWKILKKKFPKKICKEVTLKWLKFQKMVLWKIVFLIFLKNLTKIIKHHQFHTSVWNWWCLMTVASIDGLEFGVDPSWLDALRDVNQRCLLESNSWPNGPQPKTLTTAPRRLSNKMRFFDKNMQSP